VESTMIYLTINMDLANIAIDSNITWSFEAKIYIQRCILSFQVQPMLQILRAFIQYLQYFQNYWNDDKCIMVFYKIRPYTWKHVMIVKGFITNKMYKVLSNHLLWCHTIYV
jgi:hypothetical protein